MIKKLVREIAKKHNLTHSRTMDMLIDFFESMLEEGKLVTQDLVDYFEAEVVEVAATGEFAQGISDLSSPMSPTLYLTPSERLDADVKTIVKFLLDNKVRVSTPVEVKFFGDEKAVVTLISDGFWQGQRAVVRRASGKLVYTTVNAGSPLATQ